MATLCGEVSSLIVARAVGRLCSGRVGKWSEASKESAGV